MSKQTNRKVLLKAAETANQEILVTGFIGSMSNAIIKAVLYNDVLSGEEAFMVTPPDPNKIVIERNVVSRLVFDPIIARQFANWLMNK